MFSKRAVVYKITASEYFLATSNGLRRHRSESDLSLNLGDIVEISDCSLTKIDEVPGLEVRVCHETVRMIQEVKGVFSFKLKAHKVVATEFFEEVLDVNTVFAGLSDNQIVGKTVEMGVSNGEVTVVALSDSQEDGSRRVFGLVYHSAGSLHRVHVSGYPDDFILRNTKCREFGWVAFWIQDGKVDESRIDEVERVEHEFDLPEITKSVGEFEIRLACFPCSFGPISIRTRFGITIRDRYNVLDSRGRSKDLSELSFRLSPEEPGRLVLIIAPFQKIKPVSLPPEDDDSSRSEEAEKKLEEVDEPEPARNASSDQSIGRAADPRTTALLQIRMNLKAKEVEIATLEAELKKKERELRERDERIEHLLMQSAPSSHQEMAENLPIMLKEQMRYRLEVVKTAAAAFEPYKVDTLPETFQKLYSAIFDSPPLS